MIGKIILGDALKITGNVLRTTGDVAGSIVNAGGNFIDRASDIGQLGKKKIKGKVILIRSNVLNITEFHSSILDGFTELLGSGIVMQLVSATEIDSHSNERQGKVGRRAYLEKWLTSFPPIFAEESVFEINFEWEDDFGYPGAFYIRNGHTSEFFLKSLTLEDVPNYGKVHFDCNSWVYPQRRYNKDRIFFANKTYLPNETPKALRKYREEELLNLRGDGKGEHQEWDRIYDYDVYNDIADPDAGHQFVRPILGGSTSYPYPRRGRTGRPRSRRDVNYEERLKSVIKSIYVPRDESIFGKKISEIFAYQLKSIAQSLQHKFGVLFNRYPKDFGSFKDVLKLYNGGFPLPTHFLSTLGSFVKEPFLKELLRTDGEQLLKFPLPQLIQDNYSGWRTDQEFAREMLAGANPLVICGLQEFPPSSKLDPNIYGDQKSKITEEHIMNNLDGFTVNEAMKQNKLYILDHHDYVIPFLRRINTTSSTKIYATRTILFLKKDGTLKPLAIELSLPHPQHNKYGVISRVLLPATKGVAASLWQLAKAYVAINDNGHHQLISHWLNTHAVIEPFVIATNRQLSVLHPIHKLLIPHFKDTMKINAIARQSLINVDGIIERTHYPTKYSMEMSSFAYKNWVFPEQALPTDLIKRGVAIEDANSPHGLKLLIEDYHYASDGLEIWSAIKTWVVDYCSFYYKDDKMVSNDSELQSWWKELREKGHEDKKNEHWWPKMQSLQDLIDSCTIIIWISSALHALVNFGQYHYGGFFPNRPLTSTRFLPEEGSIEYEELRSDPEKAFMKTIQVDLSSVALTEISSRHSSDEVYLGERNSKEWTLDEQPLQSFEKFKKKLVEIENMFMKRNQDPKLKNRVGPVNLPYTLMFPTSTEGLTGRGIPNSISM